MVPPQPDAWTVEAAPDHLRPSLWPQFRAGLLKKSDHSAIAESHVVHLVARRQAVQVTTSTD